METHSVHNNTQTHVHGCVGPTGLISPGSGICYLTYLWESQQFFQEREKERDRDGSRQKTLKLLSQKGSFLDKILPPDQQHPHLSAPSSPIPCSNTRTKAESFLKSTAWLPVCYQIILFPPSISAPGCRFVLTDVLHSTPQQLCRCALLACTSQLLFLANTSPE